MESQATYKVRLANGQEFGPATLDTIVEWAGQRRIPVDALLVPSHDGDVRSVLSDARLRSILQAPPTSPTGPVVSPVAPGGVLIPTGNPCALTGYYLAVFSFTIIGAPLAPIAFVLGILGLRARLKRPEIHGMAHALVAIIGGFLITALGTFVLIMVLTAR